MTSSMTERPMGSIMTAVAVLLTHMLRKAVASMKPATSRTGWVPTQRTSWRAMRRWSPHRCTAWAIMKPPMKRKMTGLA